MQTDAQAAARQPADYAAELEKWRARAWRLLAALRNRDADAGPAGIAVRDEFMAELVTRVARLRDAEVGLHAQIEAQRVALAAR
ncbi:MAG: hypothetical protein ACKOZX_04665, partial [Gammaproteobacteria bacterium]